MTSDEACRFAVWWSHKRKTFTTPRQAALAAWGETSKPKPSEKSRVERMREAGSLRLPG